MRHFQQPYSISFSEILSESPLLRQPFEKTLIGVNDIIIDLNWLRISTKEISLWDHSDKDQAPLQQSQSNRTGRALLEEALSKYLEFLFLSFKYSSSEEVPGPTHVIDLIWHTHQMHPEHYQGFCKEIGGRILDHDPWPIFSVEKYSLNVDRDDHLWLREFNQPQWVF